MDTDAGLAIFGTIIGAILGLIILWVIIHTAVRTALRDVVKESRIVEHLDSIERASKEQTAALALIYDKLSDDTHAADAP